MKKLFSFLIGIAMLIVVFCCFSVSAFAAPSQLTDIEKTQLLSSKTYYSFDASAKTLTISGEGAAPGFSAGQNLPDSQPWYKWKKDGSIEHIVVEEGITSLGNYFFHDMTIGDIQLPSTLKSIGSYCFANSPEIETLNLQNMTSISNYAFYMCYGLKEINIPSTVTYIGKSAFASCRILNNVTFGNQYMDVTMDEKAFFKCPELREMYVPFNAKLRNYSVGFVEGDKVGTVEYYKEFTMNAFADSAAYAYAQKYLMSRNTLDEMVIQQGVNLDRKYFSDNLNDSMVFVFTPEQSASYSFCLSGSIKAQCVLTDASGAVLKQVTYNPLTDSKCEINSEFIGGNTYYYTISSLGTMGEFNVSLLPMGIDRIEIDWSFNFKADVLPDGKLDVARLIKGRSVDFVFSDGFVYSFPFEDGAEYNGIKISYSNKLNSSVTCGENKDSIVVGDTELPFIIHIEHSYVSEVTEPTITNGGYTRHTCVLCGDSYTSDYTEQLGRTVYGYVKVMANPEGDLLENSNISDINIYNNEGKLVAVTDKEGFFVAEYAYDFIEIESYAGPNRKIAIDSTSENLGDIGIVFCDFNEDGYVNAKDFSLFNSACGDYDFTYGYDCVDVNKDGTIDFEDWSYAKSYFTYGKLDESIYN